MPPGTPTPNGDNGDEYSLVGFEGTNEEAQSLRRLFAGESSPLLANTNGTADNGTKSVGANNGHTFFMPINHKPEISASTRHRRITHAFRKRRYEHRKQVFACCLAAFSAFADVLCYHSFNCYGNMMTGNTIRLMDHLAAGRWAEAAYPLSLVPAYILGASLCTWLNKLDLSFLALGGPSQEAFSHLNPPRRLRSPQQITVLRVVAMGSVLLFMLGEVFGFLISRDWTSRWRLPFFACAFGLINAATLAAIHVVTNAVTGHWITVGLGVADDLPVLLNKQSSRVGNSSDPEPYYPPEEVQAPQKESQQRWKSSMSVAASFIGSIVVCSLIYNECLRELDEHPDWPFALLFRFAPPMGVVFSLMYTALLYWYTLPPPFLYGFSSQIDLAQEIE